MSTRLRSRSSVNEVSIGPVKPNSASTQPRRALGEISQSKQNSTAPTNTNGKGTKQAISQPIKPAAIKPLGSINPQLLKSTTSSSSSKPAPVSVSISAAPKSSQLKSVAPSVAPVVALPSFESLDDIVSWDPVESSMGSGVMTDFLDEEVEHASQLLKKNAPKGSDLFTLNRPHSPIMWQGSSVDDQTGQDELLAAQMAQLGGSYEFDGIDDFEMKF